MTEADLEVPGWKVRLEDQVGGVIAQGREFRRKSRFGTWGGVGNVELTMYIKEKRICFSVQIKTREVVTGLSLVWGLFLYFTKCEMVSNFTLSPSTCLRKGIEKNSECDPSVSPSSTPLSLSESCPLGPTMWEVPAPSPGTESSGTISRCGT